MAGHGPLVLTANRQVKRLSLADFPVPVEAVDRIRIPTSFSVRSPQHRRDLAASVRNRLAGRDIAGPQRVADWNDDRAPERAAGRRAIRARATPSGPRDAPGQEIAALRRRLRRHPSHGCPDREEHARYAERYTRLKRETEALERKVASRSHVIARTFDRVCAVLENLGYLTGDTVTAEGRLLGGLYTELDLLAAECLRRGYWDGLDTQELTACVSALSFESRQSDDMATPRLPSAKVRDVLGRMVRAWGQLDELEKENGVSFLREPDLRFASAAFQWAGGARLEDVLEDSDLTPGDFVRAVKQLIDLLDQIAVRARARRRRPATCAPPPAPRSTPSAAASSPTRRCSPGDRWAGNERLAVTSMATASAGGTVIVAWPDAPTVTARPLHAPAAAVPLITSQ